MNKNTIKEAAESVMPQIIKELGLEGVTVNLQVIDASEDLKDTFGITSLEHSTDNKLTNFLVQLTTEIDSEDRAKSVIAHELRHVWQQYTGKVSSFAGFLLWDNKLYLDTLLPYEFNFAEADARDFARKFGADNNLALDDTQNELDPFSEMLVGVSNGLGPSWKYDIEEATNAFATFLFSNSGLPDVPKMVELIGNQYLTGTETMLPYYECLHEWVKNHSKDIDKFQRKMEKEHISH